MKISTGKILAGIIIVILNLQISGLTNLRTLTHSNKTIMNSACCGCCMHNKCKKCNCHCKMHGMKNLSLNGCKSICYCKVPSNKSQNNKLLEFYKYIIDNMVPNPVPTKSKKYKHFNSIQYYLFPHSIERPPQLNLFFI